MPPESGRSAVSFLLAHLLVRSRRELGGGESVLPSSGSPPLEHPGEVRLNVDAVTLRGGDDPEQDRPSPPALRAPGEQRIVPEPGVILECALAEVVVDRD